MDALHECMEKKFDSNYIRMLRAILNKSRKQHPTKQQVYGHLPPITKTIKIGRTRHARHCWRSRNELISDVLLWTPSHDRAKAGRPARTYVQQFCADTEDLPEAIENDGERGSETSVLIAGHDDDDDEDDKTSRLKTKYALIFTHRVMF